MSSPTLAQNWMRHSAETRQSKNGNKRKEKKERKKINAAHVDKEPAAHQSGLHTLLSHLQAVLDLSLAVEVNFKTDPKTEEN